jgi:branched-chain amino acid transport system ATP-binding protein
MSDVLLQVRELVAGYGPVEILKSVSFDLRAGEVATLIGRNGMGKTTAVRALTGQLPVSDGSIRFDGQEIADWPDFRVARAGISVVPEGRAIFPNLSVRENLIIGETRRNASARWSLDAVYRMFPRLKERETHLGCNLSGGEQQMLAIGRALMTNPRLLILDEATEGLAPIVRREIWACLKDLKKTGLSMLVIDKNLGPLSRIADRHWIIEKGRFVWNGNSQALMDQHAHVKELVSV